MSKSAGQLKSYCFQSTEAEKMTRPKPRPEAIKSRKWENRIVSNPAQSVSGSAGSGHRKMKDLSLARVGERGKIPGKTATDILVKVGPMNPRYPDSTSKESDKNNVKECLPEKRAGLDLKSGKYCSLWLSDYTFCHLAQIL